MKHFKIKKKEIRRKPFIAETRLLLPKPKFPKKIFWPSKILNLNRQDQNQASYQKPSPRQ